jgi:hypothetical protein
MQGGSGPERRFSGSSKSGFANRNAGNLTPFSLPVLAAGPMADVTLVRLWMVEVRLPMGS